LLFARGCPQQLSQRQRLEHRAERIDQRIYFI